MNNLILKGIITNPLIIASILGILMLIFNIMIILSAPVAVSSFTMAEQMEADGELAVQLVVFASMISVLTIFIYIFAMKQFGYM